MRKAELIIAICAVTILSGCQKKAPDSDPTPPKLHLTHWEKNQSGGQGAQKTIQASEQTAIDRDWLGKNKADIRIVGDDDEGVRKVEVWGSATGKCVATEGSQFWIAPSPLSASFPKQSETVNQGYVKDFIAFHLDDLMASASCGTKQYQGMDKPREFFMTSGKWTISAHAENCCGGQTDGSFTVEVK